MAEELLIRDGYLFRTMTAPTLVHCRWVNVVGTWVPDTDPALCFPGAALTDIGGNIYRVTGLPFEYKKIRIRAKSLQVPNAAATTFLRVTQGVSEDISGFMSFQFRNVTATGAVVAAPNGTTFNLMLWVDY